MAEGSNYIRQPLFQEQNLGVASTNDDLADLPSRATNAKGNL